MTNTQYGLRETDIPLLEQVQENLLHDQVSIPDWRDTDASVQRRFYDQVRAALLRSVTPTELDDAARRISDALSGVGLLQPFLRDPDVEEVYVRGSEVAIEKGGELERVGPLAPEFYWDQLIRRVAEMSARSQLTPRHPAVLVDLPGGQRFTGMLPPLMDAPAINVRLFGNQAVTDLRGLGAFEQRDAQIQGGLADIIDPNLRAKVSQIPSDSKVERFLAWIVAAQSGNVLIAGEFSAGKTTLLNYISQFIPSDVPVAVLETFRELQLAEHLFQMRA
ncbi:MAG: ATPase, T2SS/T4P/T4SS family, partial [Chloroflexota bacterium]|nr:ATPase, T2SS/T4P/T4SS family [Chloroflexota bacterium]